MYLGRNDSEIVNAFFFSLSLSLQKYTIINLENPATSRIVYFSPSLQLK